MEGRPQSKELRSSVSTRGRGGENKSSLYRSQLGLRCISAFSLGRTSLGRAAQASKASQDSAGIVIVVRLSTAISAASIAARRTKSLIDVRDWNAAAFSNSRSPGFTRTLKTDAVARALVMCMTLAYATPGAQGPRDGLGQRQGLPRRRPRRAVRRR